MAFRDHYTQTAECPMCNTTLHSRIPPFGEVWDTLARCHGCGALLWKVAKHDGVTYDIADPKARTELVRKP